MVILIEPKGSVLCLFILSNVLFTLHFDEYNRLDAFLLNTFINGANNITHSKYLHHPYKQFHFICTLGEYFYFTLELLRFIKLNFRIIMMGNTFRDSKLVLIVCGYYDLN